jgi:parallel beta-helix repeat protein
VPFPFDNDLAKLYAHDSQPPPSILERAPEISPSFEPVLQRAMAKAPDDRYLSAGDLGRAAVAAAYGESLPHGERSVAVGDAAPTGAGVATRPLPPEATVARTELGGHTLAAPTGAADTGATVRTKASIRRRRMLAGAFVIALAAALGIVFAVTRTGGHVAKAHGNANKGRGRAMTLHVPSQYPTIQEAVDKAPAGATIEIAAGTFTQQVTINKPLTLTGAGIGSTTIKAPTSYNPQLGDIRAIVTIRAGARVTISKLKVAGPSKQSCTSPSSVNDGILVGERATLELRSAAVTDIRDTPVDCAHATARAIVIGLAPQQAQGRTVTVGHATISGDLISGYGDEGIDVAGSGSTATITSNTISGRGSARYQFVAGIVVQHGAIATIAHNTITANHCISPALAAAVRSGKACGTNPLVQSHNDGILVRQVGTTTTRIEGNKLSGNDVGISLWGATDCCNVSDNALTNNYYFGYLIKDETVTLSGGSVSGGGIGVAVVAQKSSSMATLSGVHIMTSGPMTQTYPPGSPRATVVQP